MIKFHFESYLFWPLLWAEQEEVERLKVSSELQATVSAEKRQELEGKVTAVVNVLVEPSESRVLAGAPSDKHSVVGIGAGVPLQFIEELAPGEPFADKPRGFISEFASASSSEAIEMASRLAAEEGLLVGPSTGAACKVACDLAARPEAAGKTIVVVFPSSGIRCVAYIYRALSALCGLSHACAVWLTLASLPLLAIAT